MARKRRYDDEIQKNSGSVGYNKDALDALKAGNYGKEYGRQARYNTSQDQLRQSKELPVLKGVSRGYDNPLASEFKSNLANISNKRAEQKAEATQAARDALNSISNRMATATNDDSYVVKRDRYNKLMQNSRLANDIKTLAELNYKNANQDATVSQEWADEYGAKNITGGYTKSQFLDTLSRRYDLTAKELNDMALTFHSDAYKKENEDYGKQLEQFGEALPILGSGASLVGTLGSGVEGVYNNIVGGIGGDDRYLSNIFSTTKKSPREGAKKNIESDVGKGLYDIGMGVADMIASQAAGSAPVFLAGNTAGEAQQSAIERGSSTRRASAYGTAAGMLDFVTNKIGLDKAKELAVDSIKSTGIKKFLKQNAIAGLGEAGENIIQDLGQTLLDTLINSDNTELNQLYNDKVASGMSESEAFGDTVKDYITQLATSGALGFAMGSTMQAGKTVLPKVPELMANKMAENKLDFAVNPALQKFLADAMKRPEAPSNISEIANQRTDDITMARHQSEAGVEGVGHFDELHEDDARINLDRKGDDETLSNGFSNTALESSSPELNVPPEVENVNKVMNESAGANPQITGEIPQGDVNSPLITEPVATDATGQSRVITKTAINSDVISRFDYENDPIIKEMATYAKHSNEVTYNNALDNVKKNGATLLDEYNTDRRIIDNDQDVDQAMILLRNLKEQIKNASPEEAESLTVQKNMLLSRLRQAGTKWGEAIQAFAKWNETPEGALINSEKITTERTKAWEGQNQQAVKANDELAGKLEEITNGRGYSEGKAKNPEEATSSRLDKALRQQGYDGTMEAEPKAPKTHEQHRVEVENSIRRELGSVADQFTNEDFEYLTYLVENKVPVDVITDEIEHRLNHGEWYTIDESTPVKKATSSKLSKILQNMGDDSLKAKNQKPDNGYPAKSHATIAEEVSNTLANEPAAVELDNPNDVEFITIMLEEGVPSWQIEDEINHRLMTGEWYSLDESIEEPKVKNNKLMSALNSLVEEPKPEKPELTLDEIREQVRNTLESEMASEGEFTDEDVNYIANLINNGATKEELAQALNTKMATGRFGVSPETQEYVNACFDYADRFDPNSKEACEAKALAYKALAEEVVGDASPFEKFEAWRYLAMLGNPKTMLRNLVGNTMFNAVTGVSNNLSALMEAGVDKLNRKFGGEGIQRTKAVLNPTKDGGLIKAAWNDAESHRYKQLTGSKYEKGNMKSAIKGAKSVFNSKAMQGIENAVDVGISDYPAVRAKYSTSLAGYMKANGLDESAFKAEGLYERLRNLSQTRVLTNAERAEMASLKETMDALEKGRDYAQKAAEYATFHEDNAVAKAFSKGSQFLLNSKYKSLRALGYGMEGVVPFKKTPANILRSGWEYSPLGAINSIAKTGKLIYENTGKRKDNLGDTYTKKSWWRGDEDEVERTLASDVIDSWSRTLTGSGLTYLGYYLMSKGILNSSEDDEKYQDDLEGIQNYSITINGKTYTIDWAAPAVMPLLLGAEIKKIFDRNAIPDEKWYGNIDEIVGSINSLLDPIFETSMLQGIQNVMESAANEIKYNDDGAIGGILGSMAMNATTGYLTQAVPTVLGQVARTVDPTRRTTDTATDSNFLAGVEKQGRKLMNKIPGLSYLNTAYRDAYGRKQNNSPYENPLANLAYQTLSPAYIRDIDTTKADKMARRTYNAMTLDENGKAVPIHDKDVFAPWKSKVEYGGEKFDPEQMETYREASGKASYAIRTALASEDWFNKLDGQKKTEILKGLRTVVNKVGLEANGYPQTGKEYEAFRDGGVPALLDLYKGKEANKTVQDAGISTSTKAGKEIAKVLSSGNEQKAQEMIAQTKDEQTEAKNLGYVDDEGHLRLADYQSLLDSAGKQKEKARTDLPALQGMGLDHKAFHVYTNAVQKIPEITPKEFARTYNMIDTDKSNKLTQGEMMDFLNKNYKNEKYKDKVEQIFAAYNDGSWVNKDKVQKQVKWDNGKWVGYYPGSEKKKKKK